MNSMAAGGADDLIIIAQERLAAEGAGQRKEGGELHRAPGPVSTAIRASFTLISPMASEASPVGSGMAPITGDMPRMSLKSSMK